MTTHNTYTIPIKAGVDVSNLGSYENKDVTLASGEVVHISLYGR